MVSVVNASGNQDIDGILWGWKYSQTNITYLLPDQFALSTGDTLKLMDSSPSARSRRTRRGRLSTT